MKRVTKIAIVSLACAFVAGAINAADQRSAAPVAVVSRYSGIANVPARTGTAATPLRVEIKDWHFVRSEGAKLPAVGFYIAQLKSGQIDTEIGGKKEHRNAGDIWTVAVGESMTVNFPRHSQAAQLQTITIAPGAR